MADWIRMPSGVVRGIDRGMGVLDGGGDRRREGASHCNQLGLCDALFSNYFEDLLCNVLYCLRHVSGFMPFVADA